MIKQIIDKKAVKHVVSKSTVPAAAAVSLTSKQQQQPPPQQQPPKIKPRVSDLFGEENLESAEVPHYFNRKAKNIIIDRKPEKDYSKINYNTRVIYIIKFL